MVWIFFNYTNKEPIYGFDNQTDGDKVLNDAVLDIQFEVEKIESFRFELDNQGLPEKR